MNRDRSYYRKQRMRAIHRKETILRQLGGEEFVSAWARGAAGRLSKGKIHCSCWMCRRKSYDDPQIRDKRAAMDAAQQLREIEELLSRKNASQPGPTDICRPWSGSVFDPIFDHSQGRNTWK